jgi:5-methylthioribose kinase
MFIDIEQPAALRTYLQATGRAAPDESVHVTVLTGGVSNRTVLIEFEDGRAWVLKQPLERLRVEAEWLSGVERAHYEALGLRWLARLTPNGAVPGFVFEDHEQHILAMEAVPQPHENWKTLLLAGRLDATHVEQFARLLAAIHVGGFEHREEIAREFGDRTFFETLRLQPYYGYAAECVPEAAQFLLDLIETTRSRRITFVHGDYSPKNILVSGGRLVLLDHEVIHFGDPAFDLGFSLCHFLSKAHHLPDQRSAFADAARLYWQSYFAAVASQSWSSDLESHAVRHTIGCLLARVAGKSPLEYLGESERRRQQAAALCLVNDVPIDTKTLTHIFVAKL